MGDFSSNTTCKRLYAGNPVLAGLDAPPLYVATRPGVLPSVRAPGARPTPAAGGVLIRIRAWHGPDRIA